LVEKQGISIAGNREFPVPVRCSEYFLGIAPKVTSHGRAGRCPCRLSRHISTAWNFPNLTS